MLTKMVVRKVQRMEVERSWLKIAKMHVTKLRVYYEGTQRPIELLCFSDERVDMVEIPGGLAGPPKEGAAQAAH